MEPQPSSVLQGKLVEKKKQKKTSELRSDVKTDDSSDHLPLIIQRIATKKREEASSVKIEPVGYVRESSGNIL